jgi:hypothetical protein
MRVDVQVKATSTETLLNKQYVTRSERGAIVSSVPRVHSSTQAFKILPSLLSDIHLKAHGFVQSETLNPPS